LLLARTGPLFAPRSCSVVMGSFPDGREAEAGVREADRLGGASTYCDIGFGLRVMSLRRSVAGDLSVKDRLSALCLRPCGGIDWLRGGRCGGLAGPDLVVGLFHDPAQASQRASRSSAFLLASLSSRADLAFSRATDSRPLVRNDAEDLRLLRVERPEVDVDEDVATLSDEPPLLRLRPNTAPTTSPILQTLTLRRPAQGELDRRAGGGCGFDRR